MTEAPNPPAPQSQTSSLGCLLRLFWMLPGNALPLFTGAWIAKQRSPWFSPPDLVFWAGIFFLLVTRYLDIRYCNGGTASGEPATMAHWRKHALLAVLCGGAFWAAMHGVGMLTAR